VHERYHIEWAPVAQTDLDEILEYIADRDCVDAAIHVYEMLMERIEKLVSHPDRCRIPHELRKLGVTDYRELIVAPYSIFFRIQGQSVGIVGVLDRRRDLEDLLLQRVLRR
jgi:plasmid stabilization system protein ParE